MVQTGRTKKVTYSLPTDLMKAVHEAVEAGYYSSRSALVTQAIESELERARADHLQREFEGAARDPLFRRDISETAEAFGPADSETARMMPDD